MTGDLRTRLAALVYSPEVDRYRYEAARGLAIQPYASNRYLRLVDELRALLDADQPETPPERHALADWHPYFGYVRGGFGAPTICMRCNRDMFDPIHRLTDPSDPIHPETPPADAGTMSRADCRCPDDCDCDGRFACEADSEPGSPYNRRCALVVGHEGMHRSGNHGWTSAPPADAPSVEDVLAAHGAIGYDDVDGCECGADVRSHAAHRAHVAAALREAGLVI